MSEVEAAGKQWRQRKRVKAVLLSVKYKHVVKAFETQEVEFVRLRRASFTSGSVVQFPGILSTEGSKTHIHTHINWPTVTCSVTALRSKNKGFPVKRSPQKSHSKLQNSHSSLENTLGNAFAKS